MALKIAIQMDPIDAVDILADSTFALALEAQKRGHQLYHYLPDALRMDEGRLLAQAQALSVRAQKEDHFTLGAEEAIDLKTMDVVWMRQDPPFDMAYITATHLLEHIHPKTLVVNDPVHVRNAPEKLLITHFPELIPPTLITRRAQDIYAFRERHKDIIVKPLFGNGGAGVFRIKPDDENLSALIELYSGITREPMMVQRYLPEVRKGDKRIILVDGEAVGAVNRVPAAGESRSNLHVGGRAEKTDLTTREKEICTAIGPTLKERGLIFVGIDVIGDYLTEINVTSPTGIQEIGRLSNIDIAARIWDVIEEKRAMR